jgi:hypothetical protein
MKIHYYQNSLLTFLIPKVDRMVNLQLKKWIGVGARVARWFENPDLGKFWRVLQWEIMVYFMTI